MLTEKEFDQIRIGIKHMQSNVTAGKNELVSKEAVIEFLRTFAEGQE